MTDAEETRQGRKVAELIDRYDLDGFGAEMEARWTGEGGERASLRDLAARFNKRLLETSLRQSDVPALDRDVDRLYRDLTDESVSSGVRTDARNELRERGIDPERLQADFVSYQSVRRYLTRVRGAEYDGPGDEEKLRKDLETVQQLLTRTHAVTEERIEGLRDADRLAVAEFEVVIDATVLCRNCDRQHLVGDLFEQGGCECLLE